MAFHTDIDFVTLFLHNGTALPNVPEPHADFDGTLVDGTKVNENVTLGAFMLAGVRMMPFVAQTGAFQDRISMDRILFAIFLHENKQQGISTL